jgi:hypothetical protein
MKRSTHAPGSWIRRWSGIWQYDPTKDVVGKEIARVLFPVSTREKAADDAENDEAFANARLIAASPDLLAACLAMLSTWGSDDEDAIIAARDQARTAVAKATGQEIK